MPRADVAGALGAATSLAPVLDFDGPHPRHFGAPPAQSRPFVVGSFDGEVARGASCNCRSISLVPHCNGTHTETVAHLTRDPLAPGDVVPLPPLPALLLDVRPVLASATLETAEPAPRAGDRLVTATAIDAAWRTVLAGSPGYAPRVVALRTGALDASAGMPPYVSLEAARLLVERGIEHLILELPSMDRAEDEGRLAAHRVFFGLPAGSTRLADATRPGCTITELALIPASLAAGPCAIQIQLAPWLGDAVPSRPVHYAWQPG